MDQWKKNSLDYKNKLLTISEKKKMLNLKQLIQIEIKNSCNFFFILKLILFSRKS